nr:transposase [Lachnospiraceae bacterium]
PKDANPTPAQAIACEAVKRIDAMYHMDGRTKGSSLKEKLDNRKQSVKPLVDAYFAWIKTKQQLPCSSSKLKEAMNYAVYQEKYLRRFLDDPELPMDNNDALSLVYFYPHLLSRCA